MCNPTRSCCIWRSAPLKFYGRDAVDHDQVREWLFWEANRIGISVPNLRYALRWVPDTKPEVLDWLRARALADLDRLNSEFAQHKFLLGDIPTVADIACCGYLFWADQAEHRPRRAGPTCRAGWPMSAPCPAGSTRTI